jgi:multidrug efflux pump subunit AcrA (membrane-fusion protein)
MSKIKKMLIPIGIVLVGFMLMKFFAAFKPEIPVRESQKRKRYVKSQVVQLTKVPTMIQAFGRLTSSQPVTIISEVNGSLYNGEVPFKPGQTFRKGQLLAKIDDRQVRLELNSAKSDLMNALSQVLPEFKIDFPDAYPQWQQFFEGINFQDKLPYLPPVNDTKMKLYLARFNVYKLYFAVQNIQITLGKHYIYAPFDGAITSTVLRAGATVRPGAQLGEIINLQDMEVEVSVSNSDLRWIKPDTTLQLTSRDVPGEWSGKISRIGKVIDAQTQSVPVYITLAGGDRSLIYDGLFMNTFIPGNMVENAFIVPNKAVYEEKYVYLVKNGELVYQPVDVARRQPESVVVNGGLQNGDTLVVELLQGVAPGMSALPVLTTIGERSGK